jgi:hypothetical protein
MSILTLHRVPTVADELRAAFALGLTQREVAERMASTLHATRTSRR